MRENDDFPDRQGDWEEEAVALLASKLRPGLRPQRQPRDERLARALALRHLALKLIDEQGHWAPLRGGPEAKQFEDDRFLIMFYVRPPVPVELRCRFSLGPLHHGLYTLELWDKPIGKVLNLSWNSVGALPHIVSFRPGQWEEQFRRLSSSEGCWCSCGENIVKMTLYDALLAA